MTRNEAKAYAESELKAAYERAEKVGHKGKTRYVKVLELVLQILEQEPKYCDRNICLKNEYNGIGCDECEVTKSQEPKTDVLNKIKAEILIRDKNVKDVRTDGHCFFTANEICEIIDKYKAESEPKTGHWFVDERPESDKEIICSNCEQPIFKYHKMNFDYRPKYCPNCGAKMD